MTPQTFIEQPQVPREEGRRVPCPACGAGAGERCIGVRRKVRESNHLERVHAAVRAGFGGLR